MFLTALLACTGSSPDSGTPDTTAETIPEDDAPYLGDPDTDDAPTFDSAAVAAAVEEAMGLIRQIEADPLIEAYDGLMENTDSGCPLWSDYKGTPLWYDACTTDSGMAMEGYGLAIEWTGEDDGSGISWWGTQLYSTATIVSPDGDTFTAGGGSGSLFGTSKDGLQVTYSYVEEGYSWDGPEAEGTWLEWGLSPTLVWYMLHDPSSGGRAVTASGSITIEDGDVAAVVLDSVNLVEEAFGSTCGIEPDGTISVLDSEGKWYDLIFDGPLGGEACDGCATAWYRGVALGEACVDFSVLLD